jgi:hypothetical protein
VKYDKEYAGEKKMGYQCIFLVEGRCTASATHFFPNEVYLTKYCTSLDSYKCPVMITRVTNLGEFMGEIE